MLRLPSTNSWSRGTTSAQGESHSHPPPALRPPNPASKELLLHALLAFTPHHREFSPSTERGNTRQGTRKIHERGGSVNHIFFFGRTHTKARSSNVQKTKKLHVLAGENKYLITQFFFPLLVFRLILERFIFVRIINNHTVLAQRK